MKEVQWNWKVMLWAFGIYLYLDFFRDIMYKVAQGRSLSSYWSSDMLLYTATGSIPFMGYAIVYYWILIKFFKKVTNTQLLLFLMIGAASMIGLRYFIEEVLLRWITGSGNYHEDTTLFFYYIDNIYYSVLYGSIGIIYFFVQYSIIKEKRNSELEIENKATQLQFLRNQVNPHFLFNSLNNIYSLVYQKSDNALPSVGKLSKLLRYSLYESESKVSVDKEIEHIRNYMDLEQLRREQQIEVVTNFDPDSRSSKIPPYLLLPFVENAYKHGDLHNTETPITIDLKISDNKLLYEVSNRIKEKQKDSIGGIGLPNIRKRLELLYGDQHFLDIQENGKLYIVKLGLPI